MSSAARIGIGNLAGVALAISMGGPELYFDVGYCDYRGFFKFRRKYACPNL